MPMWSAFIGRSAHRTPFLPDRLVAGLAGGALVFLGARITNRPVAS
jgi:hypothetical protein